MPYTARRSELHYPLAIEFADALAIGAHNSAWVDMSIYHRAWLVINVGQIHGGGTLNAQIRQANTAAGGGAKVIADKSGILTKAITPLTQAGGDSDSLVCIELQTEELDVDNGFRWIRFEITIAGNQVECAAILYGVETRFAAVPITNWAEIID